VVLATLAVGGDNDDVDNRHQMGAMRGGSSEDSALGAIRGGGYGLTSQECATNSATCRLPWPTGEEQWVG
jgi:hypothetical protein